MHGTMHTTRSKEQKFYTVIEGVPEDLNREQILSLTSHISRVLSLVILKVHTRSNQVHRIGIVEVADCESIFRLTSRQFLVGPGKILRFRMVSPESKLVRVGLEHPVVLKASYSSSDRSVFSSVVELLGRHGEASLVSMKGQAGLHELMFRVPQSYSLREVSTNLSLHVAGCLVKLEYPEAEFAADYFQPELAFLEAADPFAHLAAPQRLVSEEARFFHPSPEPAPARPTAQRVEIWNNTYTVHDDELSEDEDYLDEDLADLDRRHTHAAPGLRFFNNSAITSFMQNRGALIKPAGHTSPTGTASLPHPLAAQPLRGPGPVGPAQTDQLQPQAPAQASATAPQPMGAASTSTKKKAKKPKRKPVRGKAAEEEGTAGTVSPPNSEPPKGAGVGGDAVGTADGPDSSVEGPAQSGMDGSRLLARICPPCSDFSELNDSLMPEVMDKWRRFAEIKNDMRKERYLEYLQAKKKEAEQLDRASAASGPEHIS